MAMLMNEDKEGRMDDEISQHTKTRHGSPHDTKRALTTAPVHHRHDLIIEFRYNCGWEKAYLKGVKVPVSTTAPSETPKSGNALPVTTN